MTRPALAASAVLLICVAAPEAADARPGDLDRLFGTNGRVVHNGGRLGYASGLAMSGDHPVIAAEGTLLRLTRRGAIDRRYGRRGVAGFLRNGIDRVFARPRGGALLLHGGSYGGSTNVMAFDAHGRLDPRYSQDGIVEFASTRSRGVAAVAARPNGALDVVLERYGRSGGVSSFLAPVDARGRRSPPVGIAWPVGWTRILVRQAARTKDGLVLFGEGEDRSGRWSSFAARVRADGTLDRSWGSAGIAELDLGMEPLAPFGGGLAAFGEDGSLFLLDARGRGRDVDFGHGRVQAATDERGRLVIAIHTGTVIIVNRLRRNGRFDPTLIRTLRVPSHTTTLTGVGTAADGGIVVLGTRTRPGDGDGYRDDFHDVPVGLVAWRLEGADPLVDVVAPRSASGGWLPVTVRCRRSAREVCRGTLKVRRGRRVVARREIAVRSGGAVRVGVTVPRDTRLVAEARIHDGRGLLSTARAHVRAG